MYENELMFFHHFYKKYNFRDFLFASLDEKWGPLAKEKNAPKGANSFL